MPSIRSQTYEERSVKHKNAAAKALLQTMARKSTNLCLSIDVTSKESLLRITDAVGPSICLLKTHIDIVEDFDQDLIERLQKLAQVHDFLIFEDRKFADIGNTVTHQYGSGPFKIASWAHITNAHVIPGPGIIAGLARVGVPLGRGLLLLAEMSGAGTLARGEYTQESLRMARTSRKSEAEKDFVVGFIAMGRIEEGGSQNQEDADEDFLILTPGVGLDVKGDALGQQYRTPDQVILESGCDVIIVGRGIYASNDVAEMQRQAERYKAAGWNAYLERIGRKT
ncbi:hypothetical protein M408DRAFT_328775 [Serendipita vermifera MAFF 305830]|uniref:Orotidine 5'-phosphate decarboxylase n=1 Tax=Serendipita vermifera MAFF 305830 TaxID=933852 RepID=A0A0C3AYC1_SERVB|nr:hypothetical protein M408DRAFT_328775 [Serendipita vermifera MAFF 305830]